MRGGGGERRRQSQNRRQINNGFSDNGRLQFSIENGVTGTWKRAHDIIDRRSYRWYRFFSFCSAGTVRAHAFSLDIVIIANNEFMLIRINQLRINSNSSNYQRKKNYFSIHEPGLTRLQTYWYRYYQAGTEDVDVENENSERLGSSSRCWQMCSNKFVTL